ncbi:HAD hydrolase family protein [Streptococcus didelphis]|uniref:HAD hydrolase family protein n=2 Tax=Streptococcus didelphis TaxID=102886 RepID=A0ABY9LGD7_9STRE|nr:HAD hydrolase family protein [Streptococcus didelphis]WMB27954.1 HAD hydrolase family protein [Streptococcus didelphis]
MYQIIAFDMDGTLLQTDKTISQKNLEGIEKVVSHHKSVVLAKGRPISELTMYQEQLAKIRYGILESGALVYDF